jgi:type I restriction enzyme S subunit
MNETLEQMAQALFKSWFVDFDPVFDNAIAKGNSIPDTLKQKSDRRKEVISSGKYKALPKELLELFPSSFEFNDELEKWIPEGWEVSTVSDLADVNCKSWSSKNKPTIVEYVDLGNTKSGNIQETTNYNYEEAPSRAKRILSLNDTIMATVRPGNKGYAFILEEGLTGSTGFAVLSPKQESFRTLVYLFLTREDNIDLLAHLADGGAYPAINPSVIMDLPIVNFNLEISKAFDDLVFPMFIKIQKNKNQNKALAKQRDVLLPQLISGKLRVNFDVLKKKENSIDAQPYCHEEK